MPPGRADQREGPELEQRPVKRWKRIALALLPWLVPRGPGEWYESGAAGSRLEWMQRAYDYQAEAHAAKVALAEAVKERDELLSALREVEARLAALEGDDA